MPPGHWASINSLDLELRSVVNQARGKAWKSMASWPSVLAKSVLGVDSYWEDGQWGLFDSIPGTEATDPLPALRASPTQC